MFLIGIQRYNSRISLCTEDGYISGYGGYTSEGGYLSERGYHGERNYGSFSDNQGYLSEGDYSRSPRDQHVTRFAKHVQRVTPHIKRDKRRGSFYITLDMDQYFDGPESPFVVPDRWYFKILWVFSLPVVCIFYVTIPDCRKPKWRSWYPMTLLTSTIWVALLTYIVMWLTVVIGYTFNVPDPVMGFAFLAPGLSFSEIIATYLASKAGDGSKAVYSIYGSNVYNLTVNLGFVWLVIAITNPPHYLQDYSIVYVNLCQLIIVLTPLLLQFTRWRLNKVLALIYLFLYLVFTTVVVLIEYDIIGHVNLEVCSI